MSTLYAEVEAAFHENVPSLLGGDAANCLQPHDNGSALPAQRGGLPPWLPSEAIYRAPVPSLCGHPAATLVNSSLPGIPPIDGFVRLLAEG
jgi:hypothetical protein